jgi:hypothetical protein
MFTVYFDASGSEAGQPALAIGGFLASTEQWYSFEKQWVKRLADDDLEYFHASEFNGCSGQFKSGWRGNEERRTGLIVDLVAIIQGHAGRKFGSVVVNRALSSVLSPQDRKEWHLCAYSLAGRTCAARVRQWTIAEHLKSVPELVFEDGDAGKGELISILRRDGFSAPVFQPKRDRVDADGTIVKCAIPLQAADLLAFELFDPIRKIERDGYIKRIKKTYREIDRVPGEPGCYEVESLTALKNRLVDLSRSINAQ